MYSLEDLRNLSGSTLPDEILQTLHDSALIDLKAGCKAYGLTFDEDSDAQVASFKDFFDALLYTRYRMDGTMDISTLDYAHRTDLNKAIEDLRMRALDRLKAEADALDPSQAWIVIT